MRVLLCSNTFLYIWNTISCHLRPFSIAFRGHNVLCSLSPNLPAAPLEKLLAVSDRVEREGLHHVPSMSFFPSLSPFHLGGLQGQQQCEQGWQF